ncbi:MAG: MFS transporter [Planctomycetes bacterium]|nr:MFS transporter [Planctomycetota bacterium]
MATPHPHAHERPTRVRWLIFALVCATSFILYLHRYTWGFIKADVQEEFGWSEPQLGVLDGLFGVSYALGQIPSGILCDWFGPHVLLGSIIVLWSVSMGAVALATGLVSMAIARFAFGLTQAGCYPTISKVTKLWFPLAERTRVQAWIATFFGRGGGALAFVLLGTVLMGWLGLSWRWAILALTLVGLAFAVVFVLLFRNTPGSHPAVNDAEVELITEGRPDVQTATRTRLRWSRLLASGNMRMFFVQQFTSAYADNVFVYWIPLFLLTTKNVDVGAAGWMAAIPLLGGAVGGMLGGELQSQLILRTGNRRWSRSLVGMAGKLLATILMFVSLAFDDALVIVGVLAAVKFFSDWSQPAVWGTITDIAGRNAGSVFGAVNTCGSIASFLAGPTIGMLIMFFATREAVEGETVTPAAVEAVPADDVSRRTTRYQLANRTISRDQPLVAMILHEGQPAYRVEVSEDGEFRFDTVAESAAAQFPEPVPSLSRLSRERGSLRLRWQAPPPEHSLVVEYERMDYSDGWGALFLALGAVYLVSSLSWLFIDCTEPLDPDDHS